MPGRGFPVKYCRHCGRLIALEAVDCPYCNFNTIRHHAETICPFCKEPLRKGAVKCRYCGEFIDGRGQRAEPEKPEIEPDVIPQVDAVPVEQQQQTVVYIEKAIIAGTDADGTPLLMRPDGKLLTAGDLADTRASRAGGPALAAGSRAALPPGTVDVTPDGRAALPPGAGVPVAYDAGGLPPGPDCALQVRPGGRMPAVVEPGAPPAPPQPKRERKPKKKKPPRPPREKRKRKKKEAAKGPAFEPPPVQYECPGCKHYVYEDDNFCENCGRDLHLHPKRKEFGKPVRYGGAELCLILAVGAPIGLLAGSSELLPYAPGAVAVVLGLWSMLRITGSHGRFRGVPTALAGLLIALFWLLFIAYFRS